MTYLDQPSDLVLEGHTLVLGMPYVLVKGAISFNVPTDPIPLHGFRWSIEISFHYNIDLVQRGREGMIIGIFWEWPFVFHWPIFLLLRAPNLLDLSSLLILHLLALNSHPEVILLISCHSFHFAQGLRGIFQL